MGNDKEIKRFPRLIKRFPRLPEGYTLETAPIVPMKRKLSKIEKFERRMAIGDIPRGYDRLKKRHRKLAKLIAGGWNVQDACKKMHMNSQTFYRLRRAHPLFRAYLNKQIAKNLEDVDSRLERQVLRASQVVDESLDSVDSYFAADMAKAVLKGRGRWKNSSQVDAKHSGNVGVQGTLKVDDMGVTKELMGVFIEGLTQIVSGAPVVDERKMKTIVMGENGHAKSLPPASGPEGTPTP